MNAASLPTPRSAIRLRTLAKGEMLFAQGEATFAIFVVRRGRVRLVRHLVDGSTVPLYIAHDGDSFSEAALFSEIYHCDAIADVVSEIEIHSKEPLRQALDESREASRMFMEHMARQVIALRSRLEIRNIRSATDRVLQFIQLEIEAPKMQITFVRPLKDIAGDVGLSHEAFYRALAKLEKSGIIARNKRTITLLKQAD